MHNGITNLPPSVDKKSYDKRSHDDRIKALNDAFSTLKIKALIEGKKTIASAKKVLELAGVKKTYFYSKTALKDKETLKRYTDVRNEINQFQQGFEKLNENSPLNKAIDDKNKLQLRLTNTLNELQTSRIENASLLNRLENTKVMMKQQEDIHLDRTALAVTQARTGSNQVNFARPIVISPDKYLIKNNKYCFDDKSLRQKSWKISKEELKNSLKRQIPTRIYILIGPPCSGKTTWTERSDVYLPDRHALVIDATNLTRYDRLEWFAEINAYKQSTDFKLRAVVFETPDKELLLRNAMRPPEKRINDDKLMKIANKLEWPDLQIEMFDEMEVVRYDP